MSKNVNNEELEYITPKNAYYIAQAICKKDASRNIRSAYNWVIGGRNKYIIISEEEMSKRNKTEELNLIEELGITQDDEEQVLLNEIETEN